MEKEQPIPRPIAKVTEPFGILVDILLHPKRFFEQASREHLVEGSKVGIVSAVLGALTGTILLFLLDWALSDSRGSPLDPAVGWVAPIVLLVAAVAIVLDFGVSVAVARLLRAKRGLGTKALVFDCSLAATFLWAVPVLGLLVAPVYQVVILGWGLARAGSVSLPRAYVSAIAGMATTIIVSIAALVALAIAAGM